MTDQAFEVIGFSPDALYAALSNERFVAAEVAKHERAKYLGRYLTALSAATIVVEREYTDGDYLEDFASYYVRCFERYERRCHRLHFFASSFDEAQFSALIRGAANPAEARSIEQSYLGFIVARPLPSAVIGRTVLATYPSDNNRRNYTALLKYGANLFGFPLELRSLAYQEQDSVLAACATVSLWCAFHKTAHLFGTMAPRPAVITRLANGITATSRPIPSHGLSLQQMAHAVREVGLDPEIIPIKPNVPLVSLVYAHLRMGLPVILAVEIENVGYHAITLNGYSILPDRVRSQEVASGQSAVPMTGLRIDELYGHDDQIGPFARLKVRPSSKSHPVVFEGSWKDVSTGKLLELRPFALLIPIYNKVRVGFMDIQQWLSRLHGLLPVAFAEMEHFEWDVYLTTVNEFKTAIKSEADFAALERDRLLFKQHPRFLWRAILRYKGHRVLELLSDATDMSRSFPVFDAIWHNDAFRTAVLRIVSSKAIVGVLDQLLDTRFRKLLLDSATKHT